MNKTHVDEGALRCLLPASSFLDIGCGPGGMLWVARKNKIKHVVGIDGDPSIEHPDIIRHDFTKGVPNLTYEYSIGWSVEFVEHVEERFLHNIMPVFGRCQTIIMTHALPGETGGHHHVNLQTEDYWINKFSEIGYYHDTSMTRKVREHSTMQKDFMRKTGKVFRRTLSKYMGNEETIYKVA